EYWWMYNPCGVLPFEADQETGGSSVRIIKSKDLLVAEEALKAILRPAEAPTWLYQAARDYSERYNARYGDGLIPDSAPMVEEIAGFWRKHYGTKRWGTPPGPAPYGGSRRFPPRSNPKNWTRLPATPLVNRRSL